MRSIDMREKIKSNLKTLNKPFCNEKKDWTYIEAGLYIQLLMDYFDEHHIMRIVVAANQNFHTYVLLLAAYLSNTVFCCYDPELPKSRVETILNNYQPDVVITVSLDALSKQGLDSYDFTTVAPMASKDMRDGDGAAYVIYTSGTTGIPKGVLVRYESLENVVGWGIRQFKITDKDVYAQYAPLWFDMSMFDLFSAATVGAQIVPFSTKEMKLMPGTIIRDKKITFWNSVPQAITYIIARNQLNCAYLGSLRAIKLGGDKVLYPIAEKIFSELPNIDLFITYGPTESTIFATCLCLNCSNYKSFYDNGISPIGSAIYGVNLFLDNIEENVGEIVLEGDNVSSGYLGEPMSSAFSESYDSGKKRRFFHTGDYAFLHDGCYYFVGRRDSQVKVSGNRVDLQEIESVLSTINVCAHCLLIKGQIVLVYDKATNFSPSDINSYLKSLLPIYAIPTKIISIDSFPMNSNDKIDKKKLEEELECGYN